MGKQLKRVGTRICKVVYRNGDVRVFNGGITETEVLQYGEDYKSVIGIIKLEAMESKE